MAPTSFRLASSRLEAVIDAPGAGYTGSRFDWTTQVRQVLLDGRHPFLTREHRDDEAPGTQGWGLAGEFGIATPVGFDGCPDGAPFPKIGVGLLTRPDRAPYHFYRPYAVEPARFTADQTGPGTLRFGAVQEPVRGLGWSLVREWRAEGNDLVLETTLTNTGSEPWATEEYLHNFLAPGGRGMGPDWALTLPVPFDPEALAELVDPEGLLEIRGPRLTWTRPPEAVFFLADPRSPGPGSWTLSGGPDGLSVTETAGFAASRFHLWGRGHVVSPELYRPVALVPGQEDRWTRRWTFDRQAPSVVS